MKLSEYARLNNITYRTAWNYWKSGKLKAKQLESGTIVIEDMVSTKPDYIVTYSRVSSSENKSNLLSQNKRLVDYCNAIGFQTNENIMEIGSGLNDQRSKLEKILKEGKITKLIVEHKDRLTRFGFKYIELLCYHISCEIIVVNKVETNKEDLIQDFISIITSFCARIYGQRRNKRRTEKLIKELETKND
jgi:putative resolvase